MLPLTVHHKDEIDITLHLVRTLTSHPALLRKCRQTLLGNCFSFEGNSIFRLNILLQDSGSLLTTSQGSKMLCLLCLANTSGSSQHSISCLLLDCDSVTFALQNFGRLVRTKSRTSNGFNFCLDDVMSSRYLCVDCAAKWYKVFVLMLRSLQEMRIRVSLVYFKSHWILYVAWSKYKTCGIWI